jgi:hypothetical protein
MAIITLYKIRSDGVYDGDVDFEGQSIETMPIPPGFTDLSPHPIPSGTYAFMLDKWVYEQGEAPVPPPPDYAAINKSQAEQLLQATDWVELPSVSNPANTPHLENVNEFLAYRTTVRAIAVNPPTEPADFPAKPDEVWV